MNPVYQITEYGSFITGKEVDGYKTLPPHTFEQLENFILGEPQQRYRCSGIDGSVGPQGYRQSHYCQELCRDHDYE
mgnify:CR=1 FL=1